MAEEIQNDQFISISRKKKKKESNFFKMHPLLKSHILFYSNGLAISNTVYQISAMWK